MNILFVVRSIGYGGASKQLAMTANALCEKGHVVCVYSYNWNKLEQQLLDTVKYIPEKRIFHHSFCEYVYSPIRIRRQIKETNPDVIVAWRTNAGCMSILAAIGLSKKVVFCERSDPYMETNWMLKIAAWVADFSDGGIFQTNEAKKYYKRLQNKSEVIANPIIAEISSNRIPYNRRQKEIVNVSRLYLKQKRQDILIRAFKLFHDKYPDYTLKLYGDGNAKSILQELTNKLGISESVFFMGVTNNVVDTIRTSKLFVLSSDYEGIPNVLLESMSAGVPVISTDTSPGGVRIIVKDGVNGYIVPIRNAEMLAERMCILVEHPEIAERFIENGYKNLQEFKPEAIFNKWEDYLVSVLHG